jgi:LPP20 lipoprotein
MRQFRLGGGLLLGLVLAACSTPESSINRGPEWVRKAGGIYSDEAGKTALYAVGIGDKSPSMSFQRTIALNNARQEMQATLSTYVQRMVSTYTREAADRYNMKDTASLIENNEDVGRSISQGAILGAQQIDSYFDEKDGTLYVLLRLDLNNQFLQAYEEKAKERMREEFAKYSKDLKKEALDEMDKAIQNSVDTMKQEASPWSSAPTKK